MRLGTRLALVCLAFGAVALTLFLLYGRRATAERPADDPLIATRELVIADNTAVGLLGVVDRVTPISERPAPDGGRAIAARVDGSRADARVYADLVQREGRWTVVRATLVFADGARLPLRGPSPSLAPSATGRTPPSPP